MESKAGRLVIVLPRITVFPVASARTVSWATNTCALKVASLSLGLGTVAGGYAETVLAPVRTLFAVPDHVNDDQAALAEPLAIGMHGREQSAH